MNWVRNHLLSLLITVFILICSISIVWFMFDTPFNDGSGIRNSELFARYGDFIGGLFGTLFSVAGFVVLYITFIRQRTDVIITLNEQRAQFQTTLTRQNVFFEKEAFERRFFEMINIHRQNVAELQFTYYALKKNAQHQEELIKYTAYQRKVFKIICGDLVVLEKETRHLFEGIDKEQLYQPEYLKETLSNPVYSSRRIELSTLAKYDILYRVFFFGVSVSGRVISNTTLFEKYDRAFLEKLFDFIALKPKTESVYWPKWKKIRRLTVAQQQGIVSVIKAKRNRQEAETVNAMLDALSLPEPFTYYYYANNYEKFYGGHQFRLSHYFRHLFQAVNFINDTSLFSYLEKYNYVKLLRAQLSTYEQILLFINSLSIMGRPWEFEHGRQPHLPSHELITKYGLIRNIHANTLFPDVKVNEFYPLVDFDLMPSIEVKKKRAEIDWDRQS